MISIKFDILLTFLNHITSPSLITINAAGTTNYVTLCSKQTGSVFERCYYSMIKEKIVHADAGWMDYITKFVADPRSSFPEYCQKYPMLIPQKPRPKQLLLPPFNNVLEDIKSNIDNGLQFEPFGDMPQMNGLIEIPDEFGRIIRD